jgi:hypothetical protein
MKYEIQISENVINYVMFMPCALYGILTVVMANKFNAA